MILIQRTELENSVAFLFVINVFRRFLLLIIVNKFRNYFSEDKRPVLTKQKFYGGKNYLKINTDIHAGLNP